MRPRCDEADVDADVDEDVDGAAVVVGQPGNRGGSGGTAPLKVGATRACNSCSIANPSRINVGSCMNPAASQNPTGRPAGVYPTGTAMLG